MRLTIGTALAISLACSAFARQACLREGEKIDICNQLQSGGLVNVEFLGCSKTNIPSGDGRSVRMSKISSQRKKRQPSVNLCTTFNQHGISTDLLNKLGCQNDFTSTEKPKQKDGDDGGDEADFDNSGSGQAEKSGNQSHSSENDGRDEGNRCNDYAGTPSSDEKRHGSHPKTPSQGGGNLGSPPDCQGSGQQSGGSQGLDLQGSGSQGSGGGSGGGSNDEGNCDENLLSMCQKMSDAELINLNLLGCSKPRILGV